MSRARPWAFQAASAATAPLWVISMLAPGYLAARNLELLLHDPVAGAVVGVCAVLLCVAAYFGAKRIFSSPVRAVRVAV